jgi:hypothetical protein
MVTLALVAMLWGNCLSCPDMLAATASHQPDHSCCHKPQPAQVKCHTQSMQHFVQAETHAPVAPVAAELAETPALAMLPVRWTSAPLPALHAPPGSPTLSTTLRI